MECGAFDGERNSNTLFFEKEKNWTGLLIEADPIYYAQLKTKNRKAFSINACLSIQPYPVEVGSFVIRYFHLSNISNAGLSCANLIIIDPY